MPQVRTAAVLCLSIIGTTPAWAQGTGTPTTAGLGLDRALDLGLEAVLILACAGFALMLSASSDRR